MKLIDKSTLVAELNRLIAELVEEGENTMFEQGRISAFEDVKAFINHTLEVKEVDLGEDEPVSNDLEEAANTYIGHAPEVDECSSVYGKRQAFKAGAQWQKEHLWKDAQGDDLPEIDKEVIALIEAFGHYKVIFAHRVDENAEIHTSIDGKPLVLHPKKHGKGGWNISNIKWWLDIELPKMEE